jgi:peptide/nickel transport system substrate-binding protein
MQHQLRTVAQSKPLAGWVRGLAAVLCCGLWLSACTQGHGQGNSPESLTLLLPRDIQQLDPRYVGDLYGLKVSRLIFASLTRIDPLTLETVPDLARELKVIGDAEYVVSLRPGLRFSDGSTLDAEDVVATYRSVVDPALQSRYASTYQRIVSVSALDPLTVQFRLNGPHASFPTDLELPILRAEDAKRRLSADSGPVIGAGPYVLARRQPGVIELASNPHWYNGTPHVPRIRMLVVHDDNTRALRLLSGAADLSLNGVPAGLVPLFTERSAFAVDTAQGIGTTYLGINTQAAGLRDVRVRKALAHAIDRQALITAKFSGRAELANSFVAQGHWAYDPEATAYTFDRDAARALLDQAGLTGTPRARWVLRCNSERSVASIARAIAAMLGDVGISVRVQTTENATLLADLDRGHFELSLSQFSEVIEPHVLSWFFASDRIPGPGKVGLNRWRYSDPASDEAMEIGRRSLDREERKRAYVLLQRRLADQLPVVPLWHEAVVAVRSKRVGPIQVPRDSRFTTLAR